MKPKSCNVIAMILGIILAALIGEVILRVYKFQRYSTDTLRAVPGSNLVFEHKPSVTFVNRHGIEIKYNSLGFIGEEVGPKAKGTFRILGIGDSITAGEYLPQNERYLNRVGEILSRTAQKRIEVINAGVSGYNTWQELELLRLKGLGIKPDLILIGVCLNDDSGWRPEFKKTWFGKMVPSPRHHKKARYFNFLYQRSRLYEFFYDFLYMVKKFCKEGRRFFDEYHSYEVEDYQPNFQIWEPALKDMILVARKNSIEVLFVIFPFEPQVLKGEEVSFAPLVNFFEQEDAYFLDLIKNLNGKASQHLFLKRDPVHLNALGTDIAAQVIANYIVEKGILQR